jgi:hypothetical protein
MNKKLAYNIKRKRYKMVGFIYLNHWFLFFFKEFIVQFTGYYNEITRSNYLTRIFKRNNVSFYEIIKRNNLMQHYPSDFDIVRVCYLNSVDIIFFFWI